MILRLKLFRLSMKLGIYVLPLFAYYVGWAIWRAFCEIFQRPALYVPHGHPTHLLFGAFVWAFVSEHYKVTSFDELFRERTGVRAASSACIATLFVLMGVLYFSRNARFPRGLLVCDLLALLVLTVLLHSLFRIVYRSGANLAKPVQILIIGADDFAKAAGTRLQRLSFAPCIIAAYVRLPGQDVAVTEHRVLEMEQLSVINTHSFDEAVIAVKPGQFHCIPDIIPLLKHLCLPARAIMDLGQDIVVREKLFQLGNLQMLNLTSTPAESLDYAILKRAFDIGFSLLVLLIFSPLIIAIGLLVKVSSSGPVLFTQERIGLNGKRFRMYKFRSMRCSSGKESDTRWTVNGDPRTTPIGAFLRKTSLDELPQFVNVLKGDMSVVGPRPERPHFVHKFLHDVSRYNHRHALKVGITGWAQVNGWRGDTSIEKRVEYDLYYLQNWSFTFDMQIILMTLFSGLINRNAY